MTDVAAKSDTTTYQVVREPILTLDQSLSENCFFLNKCKHQMKTGLYIHRGYPGLMFDGLKHDVEKCKNKRNVLLSYT